MNSSGIKRGLAVAAISATAFSGMAAFAGSATADSVTQRQDVNNTPDTIEIFNSESIISTKNDGTNSTIRLEAGAGSFVNSVTFQYATTNVGATTDADFLDIATVSRNDDGAFSTEWAAAGIPQNTPVEIRAIGISNNGTAIAGDDAPVASTAYTPTLRNDTPVNTVNLADGSALGHYSSCADDVNDATPNIAGSSDNVILTGTTSYTTGSVDLDSADPALAGVGSADVSAGRFAGVLDIDGFSFNAPGSPNPDQIVTRALTTEDLNSDTGTETAGLEDTEDLEAYTLYNQTVGSVVASATPDTSATDPDNVTITVLDQNRAPIAGAAVYRDQNPDLFVGITDESGQVLDSQATPLNVTYFVDASNNAAAPNCNGTFAAGDNDVRSNTFSTARGQSVVVDGPDDNVAVGATATVTTTVTNQDGTPASNQTVQITRSGPGTTNDVVLRNTGANGQVTYTFTCSEQGTATITAATDTDGFFNDNIGSFYENRATTTVTCGSGTVTPPPVDACDDDGFRSATTATLVQNAKTGGKIDKLRVNTQSECVAGGAPVRLFRINSDGTRVLVEATTLNSQGIKRFQVADTNGKKVTRYVARIRATEDTQGVKSSNVARTR